MREPARTVDMVLALADHSLLSGKKIAQAGYVTICDNEEVNIYDGRTAKIVVYEEAVLKGWFFPKARMWRVLLQPHVINNNTDTLLLNGPTGTESLNTTYTVLNSARILQHIKPCCENRPASDEAINNVYELPSTDPTIRYLHGTTGFPTKVTWIKAIHKGNYQIMAPREFKNVNNFFLESEETQKGHMPGKRQGERSTKEKETTQKAEETQQ